MNRAYCPTCHSEVRISSGGTKMEWDIEGRTETRKGDFSKSWVCPFCHPHCYVERFQAAASGTAK